MVTGRATKRLLVISYDSALRLIQATILSRAGYGVMQAGTCDEAKAILGSNPFDLVLLDHSIGRAARHDLAYFVKNLNSKILVFVLHSSGKKGCRQVDAAMDSRRGPEAVLDRLAALLLRKPPARESTGKSNADILWH